MALISTRRPTLPLAEAYKATRPASGLAASSLAAAIAYEAAIGGLRGKVTPFQWVAPLSDDLPSSSAYVRHVAYRPSPYATALYVAAWYATGYAFGVSAPGVAPKLEIELLDDATLTSTGEKLTVDDLPERTVPIRAASLATSGATDTTGLLLGQEVYASTPWVGALNPAVLSGADGWLRVEATAAQVLAVGWVEIPSAEVA